MSEKTPEVETIEVNDNGVGPGVPDGHVQDNGEKVVYDYDTEGNLISWHKEPAE